MRSRLLAASVLALAVVGPAAVAVAQQATHLDLAAVVNARRDTMKAMKDAMGELAAMIEEGQNFDAARVADLAALIELNTEKIPHQFPDGSLIPGSEAKEALWEEREEFEKTAGEATVAAKALADRSALVTEPADLERAFKDVAMSCRACHKAYRKPF
ncbi:c-type cytochrome [Caenispirillum bisanense]|uniref:Cytochrome c556 n=1 Tax=Caenispirillum bisanense TaxID=414052 RepID=A0A286GMT7_9PROT|nr:cytochrome c [Caenispirillum bisanense]SOD96820.1 Cytochrome c556 [Caenispirillum bisanense]